MSTATHAVPTRKGVTVNPIDPQARLSKPAQIRFAAADLVREGKLAEANLLTHEALKIYPQSEDVLAMRALILQVMQDWSTARQVLEKLLALQGSHAPAETWCHWVRVLRCEGMAQQAFEAATTALTQYPDHPVLAAELAQLQSASLPEQRAA